MIKIVNGVFGYRNGKTIIPKTSKDEPFECDKATEQRLVAQGVAVYVNAPKADETEELDKDALIARYKELGLGGNPASWRAETILKKIEEAEAKAAEETEADETEVEGEGETDEDAPTFDEVDGVEG